MLCASAAVALSFFAFASFAAETGSATAPGGGVIKYTNADVVQQFGNGEILLVYTNAAATGATFEFPGTTSARILAVGGGGGGGGAYYKGTVGLSGLFGGGGGGGAGGMIEVTNLYGAATYTVKVGAGGAGGVLTSDSTLRGVATDGESGGDTTITTNGFEMLTAVGGGGGGSETDGKAGGSGGGGSQKRDSASASTPKVGGAGTAGQGFAGGDGNESLFGGGGGGAGGAGDAASTKDPKGGIGRTSDITGESLYYAGGGGGSCIDKSKSDIRPGYGLGYDFGGGGLGGHGMKVYPTPGLDGFGGGGGGSAAAVTGETGGARGGSGIVYVRILSSKIGAVEKPKDPAPIEYDGRGHVSVEPTLFYDVTGDNVGTNAGTYVAKVKLHDNVEGWIGGGDREQTVTMVINKRQTTLTDLHFELDGVRTDGWRFGDEKLPTPVCTVNPPLARDFVVYEYKNEAGEWTDERPTKVGTHEVRARLTDDENFDCAPVTATFGILKASVVFSDLRIRNWMVGTPPEETPNPTCTVVPAWVTPVYEYKVAGDGGEWSFEKPTELGQYLVRVGAENTDDYDFDYVEFPFSIFGGHGDVFVDYVEITIKGHSPDLVNYPYPVKLSEAELRGFVYSEAGATGEDLAFTDKEGLTTYAYQVGEWNTNGVSTLYVKLPLVSTEDQVVRLYWNVRLGADVPPHYPGSVWDDWTKEDWEKVTPPAGSFGPVYRDGKFVNYWTQDPAMSSVYWDVNDPPEERGKITQEAKLAFGGVVRTISNLVSGVTYPELEKIPVNEGGNFRITWVPDDPLGEYEPLEKHIDFGIATHSPYEDLKGDAKTLTLSGRVMLANDDVVDGHQVTDQSYWQTREVVTNKTTGATLTNDVYWVHGGEEHGTFYDDPKIDKMLDGTVHWLRYRDDKQAEKTLWRFNDVIIGNVFRSDGQIYPDQCGLPYSSTQLGISSYDRRGAKGEMAETGNLILRNKAGAVVYSPCYTNGLGTVYFDAVNAANNVDADYYRIVLEVATETQDGKIPTDENAKKSVIESIEDELGKITNWRPVDLVPLVRNGAGANFTALPVTNEFALAVTTGRTLEHFYRFCARVDERRPVRFRIRRLAANTAPGLTADNGNLILLDNIIASYPQNAAEMAPYGVFDPERKLKQTIGQGGAMNPPFPAVTDAQVMGRGQPVTYVNSVSEIDPRAFIVRSQLHYRWRYLDQASNDWQVVDLLMGDGYVSKTPLQLPGPEGDVEFWYENNINAPYYKYFDYSGLGLNLSDLYTEERLSITNRNDNWYFRLRPGKSDFEGWRMFVKETDDGPERTIEMSLTSDGMWRGYVQTLDAVEDPGLYVRFESYNRQTPGAEAYATNVSYYTLAAPIKDVKAPSALTGSAGPDYSAESRVVCDAKSGYLLFQVGEATRGLTVVHADYQNFNGWNDANVTEGGKPVFVGTAWYTNENASGVSARAREFPEDFSWWRDSEATNKYWVESFDVDEASMAKGGAWEVYQPFSANTSPNGWSVGPGQWVTGNYRSTATGMALQMEGKGKGYIQFVNEAEAPRGVESISFRPRLAQAIEFGDFSYFDGEKTSLTNYTFYCRGAYDVNNRRDFAGNASLSLVGFYKAGEGCYELRVEQEDAVVQSGVTTGPGNKQRISLYRWSYDEMLGEIAATQLGTETTTGTGDEAKMLTTDGEKGNYSLLFLSVLNADGKTTVVGGVSYALAGVGSTAKAKSRWVTFIDGSADRLTSGAYGVLSANCPGRFRNLRVAKDRAQAPTTTKVQTFHSQTNLDFDFDKVPGSVVCQTDINAGGWVVSRRRAQKIDEKDPVNFGFQSAPVLNQALNVYLAPKGSTDFKTLLMTTNVSNYGSVDRITIPLWSLVECSVKIAAGGTATGPRNDIVVDDIEIRQWRGESYDGKAGSDYFEETRYGSPTNFVFTQAWIGKSADGFKSARLSARRSSIEEPTSIRSPLMDGLSGRGIGLGMISFSYVDAQTNANVLVQIATNGVTRTTFADTTRATADDVEWTTVTNFSFATATPVERVSGVRSCYLGLHDVVGAMRIVLDPKTVAAVSNATDTTAFGEIDITGILCRDEPKLDATSWWGWNLRTTDEADKRSLWDETPTGLGRGLSFALNNSIRDDVRDKDVELYPQNLPFLQTPTFDPDTVGQIDFKARKYNASDTGLARVVLFGARSAEQASKDWVKVAEWTVGDTLFTNCTYKTEPGNNFSAFRLAVTGVPGVKDPMKDPEAPNEPLRVVIDEVTVMDAIRARIAFRNTAAFRGSLDKTRAIYDILSSAQQPLCHESFGVQTEIYVAQLANEIDISSAQVRLWWYEKDDVWGWQNWTNRTGSHSAWLAPAEGTNFVYRSSYPLAQAAVIDPQERPGVVQYALEVVYESQGATVHDWLERADWPTPSWYRPVDYNVSREEEGFSAFTILDEVAPGYAWINEVNMYDGPDSYDDISRTNQYVEIAVPSEAKLTDWKLNFITGGLGSDGNFFTNTVAVFGNDVIASKSRNGASNYVFITVGNARSCTDATKAAGTIDGAWTNRNYSSDQSQLYANGRIDGGYPIGMQLVRPSGIVEHQFVVAGTNAYADIPAYAWQFSATNFLAKLQRLEPNGGWYVIGEDTGDNPFHSRSATNQFAREGMWTQARKTPGQINDGEYIDPVHPTPNGSSIILYANLEGGHLNQTTGAYEQETQNLVLYVPKGNPDGTSIVYRVDHWYELDSVTENGKLVPNTAGRGADGAPVVVSGLAVNMSNNVTITAKARISTELRETYGLDEGNRYTDAIMKWLSDGVTLRTDADGNPIPFANPNGEIRLADQLDMAGNVVTNLTLNEMYWLDMDPTMGDLVLKGGIDIRGPAGEKEPVPLSLYMMISNRTDATFVPYAPYTIRGLEPDSESATYEGAWKAATFRIAGCLLGLGNDYLDLKSYVFGPNSFGPDFTSRILLDNPFYPPSPGYYEGWGLYRDLTPTFKWRFDDDETPVAPQVLQSLD